MKFVKITGARGDWTAKVEGNPNRIAVLHDTWWTLPNKYFDPMESDRVGGKRYTDFVAALQASELVVVQRDVPGSFERESYIGVFVFKDLVIGDTGSISLNLVNRYANPRKRA